jgi:hypothetical protein
MKRYLPFLLLLLLTALFISPGCKKKKDALPCDGKGVLCIVNKLDSSIVVTIKTTHDQFPILKDNMHCSDLTGESSYALNISSTGLNKDTTLYIQSCDKQLIIVQ